MDGAWGSWSEPSCDAGHRKIFRKCDSPVPMNLGRTCSGNDSFIVEWKSEMCAGFLDIDNQGNPKIKFYSLNLVDLVPNLKPFFS